MHSSALQDLPPSLMTPQQLYHLIEGECASLRQLACTNPAKLSSMVWMELHQAKMRITQHIDREQRMQQQQAMTAAAAAVGPLTSEGFPFSSLVAPVPLTANKPGRPSHKRARAATEGVAARKVRAMLLPAASSHPGASTVTQLEGQEQEQKAKEKAVSGEDASTPSSATSATVAYVHAAAAAATAAAAAANAAVSASAAVAVRSSVSGRRIVPPASFDR